MKHRHSKPTNTNYQRSISVYDGKPPGSIIKDWSSIHQDIKPRMDAFLEAEKQRTTSADAGTPKYATIARNIGRIKVVPFVG